MVVNCEGSTLAGQRCGRNRYRPQCDQHDEWFGLERRDDFRRQGRGQYGGPGGSGNVGISVTNGSLTNTGTITAGTSGDMIGGSGSSATGCNGVTVVNGSLTNNGTITEAPAAAA